VKPVIHVFGSEVGTFSTTYTVILDLGASEPAPTMFTTDICWCSANRPAALLRSQAQSCSLLSLVKNCCATLTLASDTKLHAFGCVAEIFAVPFKISWSPDAIA
jgi:hypothetical protein